MAELFIELFSEEIPAKLQIDARRNIKGIIEEKLKKKEIKFNSSKSFSTPQRLVFVMDGIPEKIDGPVKLIEYSHQMPLTEELSYFVDHLDGKNLEISNGEHALDVTRILVDAGRQLEML